MSNQTKWQLALVGVLLVALVIVVTVAFQKYPPSSPINVPGLPGAL